MNQESLGKVMGDRVVVKKLKRPEVQRGLVVPAAYLDMQQGRRNVWWGEIVRFGLDTNASEAYNLSVGDIVGVDPVGQDCATVLFEDGYEHVWVPQEFIAAKDDGTIRAQYAVKA